MTPPLSLLTPGAGLSQHSCGYCSPPGTRSPLPTSISFGLHPQQLSCTVYQQMLDRGWRRSGCYAYKPDMGRTCCPQYTIRLEAGQFRPGKGGRKELKRWNRFVLEGEGKEEEGGMELDDPGAGKGKRKGKGRDNAPFDLVQAVHASESSYLPEGTTRAHKFEVSLELAGFTEEKFGLYQVYQAHVHKEEDKSPSGFKRFLCQTPLIPEEIPYARPPPQGLPRKYGSYHQSYRLDGKLVALGVVDILPGCVSSVYFMYTPEVEKWGMGKLSAMREAVLAREMCEAGAEELRYLYMGYYIHSCQKMRYKGEYAPSFLLDPEEYSWWPIERCRPLLDKHQYVSFALALRPEEAGPEETKRQGEVQAPIPQKGMDEQDEDEEEEEFYEPLQRQTAGCEDPMQVAASAGMKDFSMVLRQQGNTVAVGSVMKSHAWKVPTFRRMIADAVATLGWDVARQVVFSF